AIDPRREFGVGRAAPIVDISDLAAAPCLQVALDEIMRRVVRMRNDDPRRAIAAIGPAQLHCFLLVASRARGLPKLLRRAVRRAAGAATTSSGRRSSYQAASISRSEEHTSELQSRGHL